MTVSASDIQSGPQRRWSKRTLFLIILGVAAAIAGGISLFIYTVVDPSSDKDVKLAVIAPLSGRLQPLGEEIRRGAELYAEQVNRAGGIGGRPLHLVVFDDGNDPERARAAAEQAAAADVLGVIGHWSDAAAASAGAVYRDRQLPAISVAAEANTDAALNPWLFRNSFDRRFELRFLANYVRNVVDEKTVSVIYPVGAEGEAQAATFDEVLQRFGTKVVYRWDYDPAVADADLDRRGQAIGAEIVEKKLIGAILVLGDPIAAARVLATVRAAGVRNRMVGPRGLATASFRSTLAQTWAGKGTVESALNGTLVTTPLLFDTAGELTQNFRNSFINTHGMSPDWLTASSFDAARVMIHALGYTPGHAAEPDATDEGASLAEARQHIRDHIARLDGRRERFQGLMGPVAFDARGVSASPALVGTYDGTDLVAALTQLSPIREENVGNYLEELLAGRALYVNDRFMYKTNVVYSGVKLGKLTALNVGANTVDVEFSIWFRWRGSIEPQDVIFTNAVEPIRLEKPEREVKVGDMTFRSYRTKGRFFLNYSDVERAYGTVEIGIAFHHRTLNRNNLMFVSDILGMDLNREDTLANQITRSNLVSGAHTEAAEVSVFKRLAAMVPSVAASADPLVQAMQQGRVLAAVSGWALERAWLSQDVVRRGPEGDPAFVGFGKPQPEFSQLDLGGVLEPDQISARDIVPSRFFLAIAIFSLVGAVLANVLDRQERGQFWRMQTLGLRLVCWPLLLIAGGNLALDYTLKHMGTSAADALVLFYNAFWWLVPARLLVISVERFIWVPLEIKAGRKIPNVIRMITALVIYLFAFFGVVAFVMGQTITSLLATSGLLAMIIGLAVQANIANIFSGIVLNVERPFKVGDYIKISATVMGQVVDITWRTTRIRHLEGQLICLANAKVSEAEIHNYSDMDANFIRVQVYVDPRYDPRLVSQAVKEALDSFDIFQNLGSNYFGPGCQFKGVECTHGVWAARYRVKFYAKKGNDENVVIHEVLARIWERFQAHGISWAPPAPGEAQGAGPSAEVLPPIPGAERPAIAHRPAVLVGAAT